MALYASIALVMTATLMCAKAQFPSRSVFGAPASKSITPLVEGSFRFLPPTGANIIDFVASVSLVQAPGVNLVVDTPSPTDFASYNTMLTNLGWKGLTTSDVNVLVVTHGHSDHYGHASAFPNANLVDDYFFTQGSVFSANGLFQVEAMEILSGIEIWKTPGHTFHDISVI
ncbi:Protein C03F11.2, partial [Aphelenchoides avenae]